MKIELPEIGPEERTPLVDALVGIIRQLLDRIQQLEEVNQQLRDEIAILKGQKPRPQISPSCLESTPSQRWLESQKRPGSEKRPKNSELTIHRELTLLIDDPPAGAIIKDYESYVVQELLIAAQNTRYRRARYELPDGSSLLAPLPSSVIAGSHFGPLVTSYILHQYYDAHVTQPLLLEQLHEFGIDISAGQLNRVLTEGKDVFHREKAELLAAGLVVSSYIGTDDTGARHQGKNGFCTAISNDWFAYFESTSSKSRINLLEVLQGLRRDYVVNETARTYWKVHKLPEVLVQKLSQHPLHFTEEKTWQAWLTESGITDESRVRIATEGALVGGLVARGVSPDLVVLSDGAHQFVVFVHASCWIHAERPLARMIPHNDEHRAAIETIRKQIWDLYQDLKAYQQRPDSRQHPVLEGRFDALCQQRTRYPNIDAVLKEIRDHRADLLRVLQQPTVPLHNNGCESAIREYVTKRKISGSTRSTDGRRCRDTFASLKKTCRKLGVCFWKYLQDRIRGLEEIPRLADLIRDRAAETCETNGLAVPA
jgi:Transposase IS66 family